MKYHKIPLDLREITEKKRDPEFHLHLAFFCSYVVCFSTRIKRYIAISILSALGKLQAQVNTFNSLPTPQYRYLASDSNNVVDSTSGYNSFQSLVNSGTGGNNSLAQTIKSNQPLFVATSGGMQAHLLIQAGAVRFMVQNSASNLTGSFEIVAALAYSNPAIGDSNEIISFNGKYLENSRYY